MDYLIKKSIGFDNVSFDEKREAIREKLGEYVVFSKSLTSKNTTDDFGDFHAYYTPENKLEAVEFFEGNLFLDGKLLAIGTDAYAFKKNLSELCSDMIEEHGIIASRELNLSANEEDSKITSILIYRQGYYD